MHQLRYLLPALLAAAGLQACSSTDSKDHAAPPPASAAEQVARGGKVFGMHCAECHGAAGQGTEDAPPLVGSGALPLNPRPGQERSAPFHTALDVAQFVTHNMPPAPRKKLAEADYWAVLAFALDANGVALSRAVGPDNAASIVLHS